MSPVPQKIQRIRTELRKVGISSLSLAGFAGKYLPFILQDDEHIQGAVYGRYVQPDQCLRLAEGMLVATDSRIIFLDRKSSHEGMDEVPYDAVSDVKKSLIWPFSSVTLRTRGGDYTLKFANPKCINIFTHYIEERRLLST